ncbi:MBL fold metallo-hydrolase [Micromonospora cathayae]|uniref:MBL fold metallo-hydrolase n=1 Tax=Micromonospora cathayae TaxID=3028804 RepID=A0ABY7ZLB1_9ACTN|nr:MBL fold metallo-hydrolase [Micromonospora sp. HUAS 3]WDZ83672.1 MBL fold metallo-hydrolase [Micromonospora sp. HUAS 3]
MSRPVSDAHAASYRARQVPAPTEVVDGVWAIPVPLHGSALRYVTVFLIATSDGPVLVDAGYDHPSCWTSFQRSVASVGHRVEAITTVLLTHNHPDHVGFAARLREVSGARIVMGAADDFATLHRTRGGFLTQLRAALDLTGAPPEVVAAMYADAVAVAVHHEDLRLDVALTGDTAFRFGDVTIHAVPTPGHTYGHTVYLDSRGLVFTGDTMMPEGPTQLAIVSRPDDDPAGDLFRSLARIADLGATVACPAHQYPYGDVAGRARELAAFHRGEVDRVRELAALHQGGVERELAALHQGEVDRELADGAATAWQLAQRLTWKKPWGELGRGTRRFSLVHTLALLRNATRPDR